MRSRNSQQERTCFQEAADYHPAIDSKADVAIVYGLDPSFETRILHWRAAGYRIHVMTGVAWGDYAGYVRGEWDGIQHYDDAQTETGGFKLEHGISQGHDIFYMVPSLAYTRYIGEKLRRVVDAGAVALHLEEPEFWIRAGYGQGFEREWQDYYHEPWQDPTSSPDARYKASRLMQYLYTRALAYLIAGIKKYAREKGIPNFKCYVPTHSLINYAHWRIVSPESQLLSIPDCDGIIGQVWTGTSRTPNVYRGKRKQRTFEASYCEYAACAGMVRRTGKKLWQLADPIEDNPNYCWDDYRANWECTVAGSLLVDSSEYFEIMPWPRRIFLRDYPTINLDSLELTPLLDGYFHRLESEQKDALLTDTHRAVDLFIEYYRRQENQSQHETLGFATLAESAGVLRFGDVWSHISGFYKLLSGWQDQADAQRLRNALTALYHNAAQARSFIPEAYSTELQVVFNALADMSWPGEERWLSGMTAIGLAISDSLMYQRGNPDPSDPDMSSFYGLALPLVNAGIAFSVVQMERLVHRGYLDSFRIIVMTYEGQKPPSAQAHAAIIRWIRQGNGLVLFGQGDAYDQVQEWWNTGEFMYKHPQEHLLAKSGLNPQAAPGIYTVGKGFVAIAPESPKELAHTSTGPEVILEQVSTLCAKLGVSWSPSNVLALRRGPYVVAAGLEEGETTQPFLLTGQWINLFDADLPVIKDPVITPGTRWLLYDLDQFHEPAGVIASAGRIKAARVEGHTLKFQVSGMNQTKCGVRVRLPSQPVKVKVGRSLIAFEWHAASQTVLLKFPNSVSGKSVCINW